VAASALWNFTHFFPSYVTYLNNYLTNFYIFNVCYISGEYTSTVIILDGSNTGRDTKPMRTFRTEIIQILKNLVIWWVNVIAVKLFWMYPIQRVTQNQVRTFRTEIIQITTLEIKLQ